MAVVGTAGEQAEARLAAERDQRHRADLPGISAEQELALRIAQLPAARLARAEQAVEGAQLRRLRGHDAQEAALREALRRARYHEHEDRLPGAELLPKRRFDRRNGGSVVIRGDQAARHGQDPRAEDVVLARDVHEVLDLALELAVALAQHLDLALEQGDGGSAASHVRQADLCEQLGVAVEELGRRAQVGGDRGLVDLGNLDTANRSCGHSCTSPSNARSAGPVIQIGSPGPFHCMSSRPPGRSTCTSSSSRPCRRPTATAAQAPVPQARVSPVPRSWTRRRMWPRSTTSMNPTLVRLGKREWFSIAGPSRATGASATDGTWITAWGLPTETAPISTSLAPTLSG